jgi:ATP-dependent helicase/nuclease subunit B
MQWAAQPVTTGHADIWPALYQWLATLPPEDTPLHRLRLAAWPALSYQNSASLSSDVGRSLFKSPLRADPWQVETFASCPFKHFLKYSLGLEAREDETLEEIDLGQAMHQILEQLVLQVVAKQAGWADLSAGDAKAFVADYAGRIAQTLRGELFLAEGRNQYLLAKIERALDQVIGAQKAAAQRGQFKTALARVEFGLGEKSLPPLVIATPSGGEIHLSGRIDRVDILEQSASFAILDWRLGGGDVNLNRVRHGLSLQLLICLLALDAHSPRLVGKKLTPAAALYVKLLRQLDRVSHPDESPAPEDPKFHLVVKPRGIVSETFLNAFDAAHETGHSEVVSAYRKTDHSLGHRAKTDATTADEFASLLDQVRRLVGEMADQILGGLIDITPYRIGTQTPCPHCAYKSVCRFDPGTNRYRHISPAGREKALDQLKA